MDRKEPKPPGEESPDDMDLFFKDITKVLDVEIDMDDNPITKFKCVDKVGDVDDEDYASDATEPFGPVYDRKKIIKTERSRSNSPVTNSTQHARIRPPTPESRDIKPDRRKLDENIRRRETSYSKRSRSRSRDRSSRGHSHRSRDRSLNSKDRRVNSRDREDRDRNSHRRRSRSTSPIRTSQQRSLESRRPPRSRYHVRSRSSSSGSDAGKRSRDRREHKISPKRRRADSRDRSMSPQRPSRSRPNFIDELLQKGVLSRNDAANLSIDANAARAPIAKSTPSQHLLNPAAVGIQLPFVPNPMALPSVGGYGPILHQQYNNMGGYGYINGDQSHNMMTPYLMQQQQEQQNEIEQRRLERQRIEHEMLQQQSQVPSEPEPVVAVEKVIDNPLKNKLLRLSDILMMNTKGQPSSSTSTTTMRKTKVLSRCKETIKAFERRENNTYDPKFLHVPLTDPPEFVKISGRSPLIVNRNNVLFRATSVSNNVDYSQPFKNISYKVGSIIKTVNLDPSVISRKIQELDEEDRRIMENRARAIKVEGDTSMAHNDIGIQTDEIKCERCMILDLKTYRSTATQKTVIQADSAIQTSDNILAVQTSVSNLTPMQLRVIDQLMQLMESNTSPEQLIRFLTGSFGRHNPNNWEQTLQDNQHLIGTGPGDVFTEDFQVVNRSGIPPVGFRDAPQSSIRNPGMRTSASSSSLHNMIQHIDNNRRQQQQQRRLNNSLPNNRYFN